MAIVDGHQRPNWTLIIRVPENDAFPWLKKRYCFFDDEAVARDAYRRAGTLAIVLRPYYEATDYKHINPLQA